MKKLFVMILAIAATVSVASADNTAPVQVAQMPNTAQSFIKRHFGDMQVQYAKQQNSPMKAYDVVFVNGTKIEFDGNGDWTEIDCEHGIVPEEVVPRQLRQYVENNHPGQKITGIEKGPMGYQIELSNDLELKFDRDYRLMDMND